MADMGAHKVFDADPPVASEFTDVPEPPVDFGQGHGIFHPW